MAIIQESFDVSEDILNGIVTGQYKIHGGIIRHAVGGNKGRIVKHLKPIGTDIRDETKSLGAQIIGFVKQHKIGIGVTCAAGATVLLVRRSINKKQEPKEVIEFKTSLKEYADAVRNGNMDLFIIGDMITHLEQLKKCKNHEKVCMNLTTEELYMFVECIRKYTMKLAENNNVDVNKQKLDMGNSKRDDSIVNFQNYLKIQKQIFEEKA